jgi:hypothetical protein
MKKIMMAVSCLCLLAFSVNAQDEDEEKGGFKKENLFTGGSITLSFFSGGSVIGGTPIFGYRVADWVDAGIAFNYIYSGRRDYLQFNDKVRQTVYGPGVFARLYPVNFLFLQGQLEHNFTNLKYIPGDGSPNTKIKENATSFLVGGGYAQGRDKYSNTFYYISVLFDVLKDEYSPYTEIRYDPNTGQQRVRMAPIFRAGFNIALFSGRYRD